MFTVHSCPEVTFPIVVYPPSLGHAKEEGDKEEESGGGQQQGPIQGKLLAA